MPKPTIIKWWLWGLAVFLPAGILIPSAAVALAAHLEEVTRGSEFHFVGDQYSLTMVRLLIVGGVFAVGSLLALLVAWIGAVRNTRQLADQRWYQVLLWCGIAGIVTMPLFGLGTLIAGSAMMAYLVAGPDATATEPRPTTPAKNAITRWAGRAFAVAGVGLVIDLLGSYLTNNYGRPVNGVLWPALALQSAGVTICVTGGIVMYAAWWAAIFNSHRLQDKTWYNRLLWSGIGATVLMPLFGLGALIMAAVMIPYWRSAPDGLTVPQPKTPIPAAPLGKLA